MHNHRGKKKIKIKGKYYNIYITKLVYASVKTMNPMLHAALLWQVEDHAEKSRKVRNEVFYAHDLFIFSF